jgi:hypothetical protein
MKILMPVRTTGKRLPLFCINGEPLKMARILDKEQPIFGLCNAYDPNFKPPERIEQLAELYVREVRLTQPQGPYHICGFSVGGLIAYEMARQLVLKGQKVEYLALIDPIFPHQQGDRIRWLKDSFALKGRKLDALMYFTKRGLQAAMARLYTCYRMSKVWSFELLGKDLPIDFRRIRHAGEIRASHRGYRYKPFHGKGIIFQQEMPDENNDSYLNFWCSMLTEGANVSSMEGVTDHLGFLDEPHLTRLTQRINDDMERICTS